MLVSSCRRFNLVFSLYKKHQRFIGHVPVMKNEVVRYMNPSESKIILDMTFGAGGHTRALLDEAPNLKIIALDRDPFSHQLAVKLAESYPEQIIPCLGRFSELPEIMNRLEIEQNSLDGVLFDFGCSSMQMDTASRGFSISLDAKLDMRMDGERFPDHPTAADVLKYCDESDLAKIFKLYGEEKLAKKIARGIIETRYLFTQLKTTRDLANLIEGLCENKYKKDKLQRPAHVATKIFQSLRIFVNNELNEINYGMLIAHKFLKIGGRVVTISFHSLEDRIVKQHFSGVVEDKKSSDDSLKYKSHIFVEDEQEMSNVVDHKWIPLNKHVITPSNEEINQNPRSRSAKLRAAVKVK